ncbi:MAG: hypothetical protein RMJ66_08790, partial [Bacteroidia bacterium]|nr:hypothetical protein [Bacteroidia bacterium]MDW8135144.1 hypothetical protein [Bacteroidia bacterium]
ILIVILIGNAISDLHTRLIAVILLLLNSPYFLELYMGQFTFLSTALYLIGVFLHIAPIFVAFAIVIKLFPLITLPAWLRQKWGLLLIFTCADIGIITNMPYTANHPRAMIEVYERNLYIHDRDILYFSGNYGLAAMIGLSLGAVGAEDAVKPIIWGIKYGVFLFSIGIVLFSKRSHIWAQACLLLLAHFLTYHQVWEHHYSAVMLIGVSMLTPPECIGYPRMLILIALVVMALPTPFGILDIEKNPQVWDPTLQWALWKKYAILLPKVAPLLMLYGVAVWYNLREGLLTLPEVWRQVRQAQALP